MMVATALFAILAFGTLIVIITAGFWKTFEKAGHPGWASIIPIYNYLVLARIAKKPDYWAALLLIPCVNVVFFILLGISVAKSFGKSAGFGVGLGLLSPIFYGILGFGDAVYIGDGTSSLESQIEEIGR